LIKPQSQKLILVVSGLALCAMLALAGAHAQSGGAAPASSAPKLAEEQFKNIQVFKGVPADQVIPAMQFMAASLGVECEFCHVRGDRGLVFDKDDKKEKVTARKMVQMELAINKENFDGHLAVTCNSCHNGSEQPSNTPSVIAKVTEKPANTKATLPPADQLLDKYLTAVGGADALQKVSSRVEKGAIKSAGQPDAPIEVFAKAPDKRISVTHLQQGESITAFDGHSGWTGFGGRARPMSAADNEMAHMDADLSFPAHVKSMYQKFVTQPGEPINGHETYVVVGRSEGRQPLRLYFDQQSGLLLRLVRFLDTPIGRNPTQIDYADYREVNGVKVPFRWTISRPGNSFTIQIDQAQQNVPVDDAKFAQPPPSAAPAAH
jgi:hypothetical protein